MLPSSWDTTTGSRIWVTKKQWTNGNRRREARTVPSGTDDNSDLKFTWQKYESSFLVLQEGLRQARALSPPRGDRFAGGGPAVHTLRQQGWWDWHTTSTGDVTSHWHGVVCPFYHDCELPTRSWIPSHPKTATRYKCLVWAAACIGRHGDTGGQGDMIDRGIRMQGFSDIICEWPFRFLRKKDQGGGGQLFDSGGIANKAEVRHWALHFTIMLYCLFSWTRIGHKAIKPTLVAKSSS